MKFFVSNTRLGSLGRAAVAGLALVACASPSYATLLWYDGFAIGADDGAGPNYVAGTLAGQQGGSHGAAPGGIGFFDDGAGNPNPWLGVNRFNNGDTDNVISPGSLSRPNQSPASTGDQSSDQGVFGCCNTARTSRDMNTPLQNLNGTYYMSFLWNPGAGNRNDPHYRSVEFWSGKSTQATIADGDDPDTDPDPNPNLGRVGDPQLNMSIGVSSFGNYNLDLDGNGFGLPANGGNTANGFEAANRQLSVRIDGIREEFGVVQESRHQLSEHVEFATNQLYANTQAIVIKFDLSTNNKEDGGPGDTVSFFLNPKPGDTSEPTPSLVIPGIDIQIDAMSSLVAFQFNQTDPNRPGGFDELRVGTTWSDVAVLSTPEPATFTMVGLGLLGMLLVPARKRS